MPIEHTLRHRILETIDSATLLIIDEAHQALLTATFAPTASTTSLRTLEFIREIHDETRCGIILSGTPLFEEHMETGRFATVLSQAVNRKLAILRLPARPTKSDLAAFATAYGLDPATTPKDTELQDRIAHQQSLGAWLTLLRLASSLAARRKTALTWPLIHDAARQLHALETGSFE